MRLSEKRKRLEVGVMFVKNIQGGMKTIHGSDHGSYVARVKGERVRNKVEKGWTQISAGRVGAG